MGVGDIGSEGRRLMVLTSYGVIGREAQPILLASFFFCLRGGVTGRPMLTLPYGYFAFFSAGFSICEAHVHLVTRVPDRWHSYVPGTSKAASRPRSSSHPRCRTRHSSSVPRRE